MRDLINIVEKGLNEVESADLDNWNPERFQTQQEGDLIGVITNKAQFSSRLPSCLNMPIKVPNGEIRNPYKNRAVIEFVQKCVENNQRINTRFAQCYLYLTVDQRLVDAGNTHRRGGTHFDGMQGERYKTKIPMDQNYIVSDINPTTLYNQPFDARGLSTKHDNWFHELEKQVRQDRKFVPPPYAIYLLSGYHMHESPIAAVSGLRTFMRLSVSYKIGDRSGETVNPLLKLNLKAVDRDIPIDLQKNLAVKSTDNNFIGNVFK